MKRAYSVRLDEEDVVEIEKLASEYNLQPADLIRLAIKFLLEEAKLNGNTLQLPLRMFPKDLDEWITEISRKEGYSRRDWITKQMRDFVYQKRAARL